MQTNLILETIIKEQEIQEKDNFLRNIIKSYILINLAAAFLFYFDERNSDESPLEVIEAFNMQRDQFIDVIYEDVEDYYKGLEEKVPDKKTVLAICDYIIAKDVESMLKYLNALVLAKNEDDAISLDISL